MRSRSGVLAFVASLVFASASYAELSTSVDENGTLAPARVEPAATDGVPNGTSIDVPRVEPVGDDETRGSVTIQTEPSAAETAVGLMPDSISQPVPSINAEESEASGLIQDLQSPTQGTTASTSASIAPVESSGGDQNQAAVAIPADASAIENAIGSMPRTVFEAEPVLGAGESETTAAIQSPSTSESAADSASASVSPAASSGTNEHEAAVVLPAEPSSEEGAIPVIPASFSQAAPIGGIDASQALTMTPTELSGASHAPQSLPDRDSSELNEIPGALPGATE